MSTAAVVGGIAAAAEIAKETVVFIVDSSANRMMVEGEEKSALLPRESSKYSIRGEEKKKLGSRFGNSLLASCVHQYHNGVQQSAGR